MSASGPLVDSVDADDGVIDGSGAAGRSWYNGSTGATTFSFAAAALGGVLPTHVGIAFTDIGNRTDAAAVGVARPSSPCSMAPVWPRASSASASATARR